MEVMNLPYNTHNHLKIEVDGRSPVVTAGIACIMNKKHEELTLSFPGTREVRPWRESLAKWIASEIQDSQVKNPEPMREREVPSSRARENSNEPMSVDPAAYVINPWKPGPTDQSRGEVLP